MVALKLEQKEIEFMLVQIKIIHQKVCHNNIISLPKNKNRRVFIVRFGSLFRKKCNKVVSVYRHKEYKSGYTG